VNARAPHGLDNAFGVSRTEKADENDISPELPEHPCDVASLPARLDDGLTAALHGSCFEMTHLQYSIDSEIGADNKEH
jgi:hypothetical protein